MRPQNSLSFSYYAQRDRSGASVAERLTLSLCATFGANVGENFITLQPVQAGASRGDGQLFHKKMEPTIAVAGVRRKAESRKQAEDLMRM